MRVKYWKKICDFSKNKEQVIPDPASNFPVLYSLFINSGFQVGVVSPNPKYLSQPNKHKFPNEPITILGNYTVIGVMIKRGRTRKNANLWFRLYF